MKVSVELSLVPIGSDVSLSPYIARCQEVLRAAGLETHLHANGTNIEGEWDTVLRAVRDCHEAVHEMGVVRINSTLKISTRIDRESSLADTVDRVRRRL